MDLDDFLEPEVGVAVLVTAALAAPPVRRVLRQGLVYGLAGAMMAGDRIAATARTVSESAQRTMARDTTPAPGTPAPAGAEGLPG